MSKTELNKSKEAISNLLPLYLKQASVGKVHSKFNNGLNIQVDDYLIYLGCSGMPLAAFGMNIAGEKLKQLLAAVRIGELVVSKENKLIFYSGYGVIPIEYKDFDAIDLTLPQIKCNINTLSHSQLYQFLETIAFEKCVGLELDEKTGKYVELLVYGNKTDSKVNSAVINFFAGRGKGLTPSGDDILLGFTLALMSFGEFDVWKKMLALEVAGDKTTLISVAYLRALLSGYASEHFIGLIKLLDDADEKAIEKTINEVRSYGHTSGNDSLFGFFLGLQFLINQGKQKRRGLN